jgi:hypothetical protein
MITQENKRNCEGRKENVGKLFWLVERGLKKKSFLLRYKVRAMSEILDQPIACILYNSRDII